MKHEPRGRTTTRKAPGNLHLIHDPRKSPSSTCVCSFCSCPCLSLSLILFFLLHHQHSFQSLKPRSSHPGLPSFRSLASSSFCFLDSLSFPTRSFYPPTACLFFAGEDGRSPSFFVGKEEKKRAISHGTVVVFSPAFVSFESHILQLQLWFWHHLPGASLQQITFPPKLSYT